MKISWWTIKKLAWWLTFSRSVDSPRRRCARRPSLLLRKIEDGKWFNIIDYQGKISYIPAKNIDPLFLNLRMELRKNHVTNLLLTF